MRVIDRLFEYLNLQNLTPHNLERTCGIANGYLKKQLRGKGTIGSENLEKIALAYRNLNMRWLLSGIGKMLVEIYPQQDTAVAEESRSYISSDQTITVLREKIEILEKSLADKEKIIQLLESKISG